MMEDLKTFSEWTIYLKIKINLVSTTGPNGKRSMLPKNDNTVIMTGIDRDQMIQELFKSLL